MTALDTIRARRSPTVQSACRAGRRRLSRRLAAAWRTQRRTRPSRWCRRTMRLDNTVEASSGKLDLTSRPWWIAVLDAVADPEVADIYVPAGTQIGKTLTEIASILWTAEFAPAPGMLVAPDRDTAVELASRIYLNAEATIRSGKPTRLRVPPERKRNNRYIDLGSMRVYLAWSGSRQRLRGRPCRYVWLSEIDVYQTGHKTAGDPVTASHQRTKAFFRGLHYHESSPSPAPSRICELERGAVARFRWHCPCPHCGLFQELRFFVHKEGALAGRGGIAGLTDDTGDYVSQETARMSAHYICENGCRIEQTEKQAMLVAGAWVPFGCRVPPAKAGKRACAPRKGKCDRPAICKRRYWRGPLVGRRPRGRRSVGFQLWSIHSESITFGDLAAAYIEAREQGKAAEFFGNWLGLEYRAESRVPHWAALGKRNAWSHLKGTVPQEAWFLSAAVDVQGDNKGVRVSVRGWAPGRQSWLVDWHWLERDLGDDGAPVSSDLAKVTEQVLSCRFPVVNADGNVGVNPLGRRELGVKLLLIDAGHLPRKVQAWLKSLPESWVVGESPRVRAIRGDHQLSPETRWQRSEWEQNVRTGEVYEGGMSVWRIRVYPLYAELQDLILAEPGKPGAWYVAADTLTRGKAFLEQVVNFGPRTMLDPKTGAKRQIWGPINHRLPVDYWDTSVYELVAAHMIVGDLGWDPAAWQAWADEARGLKKRKSASRPPAERDAGGLDDR